MRYALAVIALTFGCTDPMVVSVTTVATAAEGEPITLLVQANGAPVGGTLTVDDREIPIDGLSNPFTVETYAPAAPSGGRDVTFTVTLSNGKTAATTVRVTHVGKVRAFAVGWHMRTSAGDS